MADNKLATKPTAAVTEEATAPVEEATTATNTEITQTIRLVRFKLAGLQADARRRLPFMSPTQEVAQAKVKAAVAALSEFASSLDKQPID
jgi:hypothetical protein